MSETRTREAASPIPSGTLVVPTAGVRPRLDAAGGPLLRAENLSKSYLMGRAPLRVLSNCSLSVQPGEFVAIMGKSGSGKSTLLHLLGAIDRPDSGEVYLAGRPLYGTSALLEQFGRTAELLLRRTATALLLSLRYVFLPVCLLAALFWLGVLIHRAVAGTWAGADALRFGLWAAGAAAAGFGAITLLWIIAHTARTIAAFFEERGRVAVRRRDFGFIFQFYHLLPELSVLENTLITRMIGAGTLAWWTGAGRSAKADSLAILQRVGLGERLRHRPSELSGGERQRVAIARALIHKPAVLFADEPSGNLDAAAGRRLMDLLLELNREGQTIVMVTHDAAIAALAHRVLRLEEGRLVGP